MSLNVLIVEGNNPKDSEVFIRAAKASCSENLKNVVLKLDPSTNVTIINPVNDNETNKAIEDMDQYNGIIFKYYFVSFFIKYRINFFCIYLKLWKQSFKK